MDSSLVLQEISKLAMEPRWRKNGCARVLRSPVIFLGSHAFEAALEALLDQLQIANNGGVDTNKLQALKDGARRSGVLSFKAKVATPQGLLGSPTGKLKDAAEIHIKLYRDKGRDDWYVCRTV